MAHIFNRARAKHALCAYVFLSATGLASALHGATTWTLKSGDTIVGEEISRDASLVLIKLPYGKLELEAAQIESETPAEPDVSSLPAPQGTPVADAGAQKTTPEPPTTGSKKASPTRSVSTTSMARNITPKRALSRQTQTTTFDALLPEFQEKWMEDYKGFMQRYLPEGWLFKLRAGYADVITNSDRSSLDLSLTAEKTWEDVHELFMYGFYNYAKEIYPSSNLENVSVDRYGAGGEYSYSFLGPESGWFATTAVDYKTDTVKFIDVMVDGMAGIGYEFMFLKEYGVDFDVALGPGARYAQYSATPQIYGNDTYFMAYLRQNLTWRISKTLKFEERFIFAWDLANMSDMASDYYEKSVYFSVGLVYSPTDVFSISLRYSYDFDAENNLYKDLKKSYAADSRFIIGVEIPIGWRK